jgi:hypothetical protein
MVRSLRVTLPPRRALFIAVLTVALLLVVSGLFWNSIDSRTHESLESQTREFGSGMYFALTLVLIALLFVLTPATAALSFIQEKIRGTSLFQQMVLLSPFKLAVGKFIGSGLIGYFVGCLVFPFFLAAAIIGEVDLAQFVWVSLFLLVGGLCCQAVGLFISAALSGPGDKFVRGGLLVGPAVGGLGALLAVVLYKFYEHHLYYRGIYDHWDFYGVGLKPYVVVLGIMIFTGVWAFAGTVRRIKASQLIPVSPWPTWLFFASAEAVLAGLLWGGYSHPYDGVYETPPVARLIFYLFLNWVALMILAGSSALGRGRLREWWSAGSDELALFQRQEIKNALTTFLVALGISLMGLTALWASFHTYVDPSAQGVPEAVRLAAIAACFTFTVAGMAAFIQYCAMRRFRIGAWAGVVLTVIFYLTMGVTGASLESKNNTAALINPLAYTDSITEDDPYMNRSGAYRAASTWDEGVTARALLHGLIAQGALAALCFGLAYARCRKTEEEILRERG